MTGGERGDRRRFSSRSQGEDLGPSPKRGGTVTEAANAFVEHYLTGGK